ncbi:MAG: hypothetical protein HY649_03335 [Acidobacteria bacterium]|nr:hypothetical protein [Acidobacteriota bacterium]
MRFGNALARFWRMCWCVVFIISLAVPARAQFISIGGGELFSQDLRSEAQPGLVGGPARSEFDRSGLLAVDVGFPVLPFLGAGLHYSYSRPALFLQRGDAFGSSAQLQLRSHTLTFDARLRTPQAFGVRLYALAGIGLSRFNLDVQQLVEVPFPGNTPEGILSPVFAFGGGVEKTIFPMIRVKLEVRDYVTPISEDLFRPGGGWHRVAVIGGIVLGR